MHKHKSLVCGLALIIAATAIISAAPRVLDQNSAIRFAFENNLEMKTAAAAISIAEARLDNSGLRSDPKLSLEYASDALYNNEGEYTLGLSISKSFPITNHLQKEKELTTLSIQAAKLELDHVRLEVATSISKTSLEIQLLDTKRSHLQEIENKTKEILAFTQSQVELGELSPFQSNQVAIELASIQQEIDHLDHEREDLTYELATDLGLSAKEEFIFSPTKEITVTSDQRDFTPSILDRHPLYQLTRLAAQSADIAHTLALARNWDDLTTRLFWENERSVDQPIGLKTDRFIGVEVSIPLPLQKKGQRVSREKLLEKAQQEHRAAALELRIRNEVQNAYRETIHSKELLNRFTENLLQPGNQNYADIQAAYQKGQMSLTDVLQAQRQLIALEEQHIEVLEEYARATLKLKLARMELLPNI